jgi:hypothetical protein
MTPPATVLQYGKAKGEHGSAPPQGPLEWTICSKAAKKHCSIQYVCISFCKRRYILSSAQSFPNTPSGLQVKILVTIH